MDAPQNFRKSMHGFNREDVVHYLEYLNAKHTAQVNQLNADAEAQNQKLTALQEEQQAQADRLTEAQEKLEAAEASAKDWEAKCQDLQQRMEDLEAKPQRSDPEELQKLQKDLEAANSESDQLRSRCAELQDQLQAVPAVSEDNSEELSRLHAMLDNSSAENSSLRAQVAELQQQLSQRTASPTVADQELEAYRRAERAERVATQRANQTYQKVNLVLENATGKIDTVSAELCQAADQFNSQLAQLQASLNATKSAVGDAVNTMYALRPEENQEN